MGELTKVAVCYDNTSHSISDARTAQILVIPSSDVRVEVRNAWLSRRYTAFSITYRYLGSEPLELPLNLNGFTFTWFPSKDSCCLARALRLIVQSTTRFLPHTLILDGLVPKGDAVTVVKDGSVTHIGSSATFRAQDLREPLHVLITKRSPDFRLSLTFSRDSEVVFCPLPVIHNGYVSDVNSSCEQGAYCNGTALHYGCDFGQLPGTMSTTICVNGKWSPLPNCTAGSCPAVEGTYLNATLVGNPPLGPLSHAEYRPPEWSLATQPFRVCAMNEFGTSYGWHDYNFAFEVPICRSYPVKYGHFERNFYQDGETATVTCLDGFSVGVLPKCFRGEWTSYNATCTENPIPAGSCQNGHVVKLNPGYTCKCNPGFEMFYKDSVASCKDIDECERGFHLCDPDAKCRNLFGGYTCECPEGKELYTGQSGVHNQSLIRNVSCIYIDECERGFHLCDPDAKCRNLFGGYTCECPEGKELYTGQSGVHNQSLIRNVSCICTLNSSILAI
ncbi:calcium binding EGF domain protein [Ostertagia ostertagi]